MTDPRERDRIAENLKNPLQNEAAQRAGGQSSLREDIRARVTRPHKGDVGRAGTNEEIFQGSKGRELR
jgi:hypothetical protein